MPDENEEHQPQRDDPIWDERRRKEGKQPNGKIEHVIEYGSHGSVMVRWYGNDQREADSFEEMSTSELDGHYDRQYSAYRIYAPKRHYWRNRRILMRAGMWPLPKR